MSEPYAHLRARLSPAAQAEAERRAAAMTDTRTPGQLCYEAYQAQLPERAYFPAAAWRVLDAVYHRAWEAAAQAVLDAWQEETS